MPSSDRIDEEEIRKRSRSTKEEADRQGLGEPEEGIRLPVPGYAEDDQASFLGVDEPVISPETRGTPPPQTLPPED